MANLFDYLDWRGDIPFSADPFNEVDNLILSELAYVDFGGIVPGQEDALFQTKSQGKAFSLISVAEVTELFWEHHTEEEIEKSGTLYKRAPFLLKKLCTGARFGRMYLGGYVNQVSQEKNEQMSAVTFFLEDDTAFAAFRGTDDTLIGWKEDFCFSFQSETGGQKSAADYLTKMFGSSMDSAGFEARESDGDPEKAAVKNDGVRGMNRSCPIRVGGHSKGGNFAVFASAFCTADVKARITDVYSNDGPGMLEEIVETDEYREILPRVHGIIPEESVFGLLLKRGYYHKVVKSSARGIWQHDVLSWQVMRNRLIEAPQLSEGSLLLEKTFEEWIRGMTMEERKEVVDVMFSLFDDTGVENVSEFAAEQFRSIPELLRAYRDLSQEDKHVLHEMIGRLFKSGANSISRELQGRIAKLRE